MKPPTVLLQAACALGLLHEGHHGLLSARCLIFIGPLAGMGMSWEGHMLPDNTKQSLHLTDS